MLRITGRRVRCRRVALSRRWIRLRVSDWRRDRLIKTRHLLSWWHTHWLRSKHSISFVHLKFVLCLHTCADRAVDHISTAREYLRSLGKFITTNNASNYREYASNLAEAEHKSNYAIVALCCLDVEFILQKKAGRGHRVSEAKEDLSGKAKLRTFAFSTPSTTGHISSTASIP